MDDCINTLTSDYEGQINQLCTIPGVKRDTAITIISEIGIDMSQFGSSKRLCCWAGLTLGIMSLLERKNLSRISRAGVNLKPHWLKAAHRRREG
jgi:transposase